MGEVRFPLRRARAHRPGDEDCSTLSLAKLLPPTHDEDLSGKTNPAVRRVRTEGFDDVTFQCRELLLRKNGDFCAKRF
jgi:hypothetical protein